VTAQYTPPITDQQLTSLVRSYVSDPGAAVSSWHWKPVSLSHINPSTGGLHRVSGDAIVKGESRPWSLVVKLLQLTPGTVADPLDPKRLGVGLAVTQPR